MASFFSNVQIHTATEDVDHLRARVIEALRAWAHGEGSVETGSDEDPTRTILVGPATTRPWIAVYDQAMETQDPARLAQLGGILSQAVGMLVVTVLVHDGDLLNLNLLQQGREVDELSNWPGYFEGTARPSSGQERAQGGSPERWRDLVVKEASEQDLRSAWESHFPFEEASEVLRRMAPVVGWSPDLVTVGYNSIPDSWRSACTQLRFRSGPRQAGTTLPVLAHEGGLPHLRARVGEMIKLSATVHNTGGASRGLSIVLWGDALDLGLIEPAVHGIIAVGAPEAGLESSVHFETVEPGRLRTTMLPDLTIPEGVLEPSVAFARADSAEQGLSLWLASRIEVTVPARALRAGSAEIHIGLVPTSNPEEGQTSWTIRIDILPRSGSANVG